MTKDCNNCRHSHENGFCFTARECREYSEFEPIIKNNDTIRNECKFMQKEGININKQLLEQFKRGEICFSTETRALRDEVVEYLRINKLSSQSFSKADGKKYIIGAIGREILYLPEFSLTWKDLKLDKPTFTKDDLKIGMVVEVRCERKLLVHKELLFPLNAGFYGDIKRYNLDLTDKNNSAYDITKVYTTNKLIEVLNGNYDSLELVWEREEKVDWSKVAVDTKILVSEGENLWFRKHFAKYTENKVYAFDGGTSFTSPDRITNWKYAKLYKGAE